MTGPQGGYNRAVAVEGTGSGRTEGGDPPGREARGLDELLSGAAKASSDGVTSNGVSAQAVHGVRLPRSKSVAQRAILAALLAEGCTELLGLGDEEATAEDIRRALDLAAQLGGPTAKDERHRIPGVGPWVDGTRVDLGESGTFARLALAAAAFRGEPGATLELVPSGSLRRRGSLALVGALRSVGVDIEVRGGSEGAGPEEGFDLRIRSASTPASIRLEGPTSSQEVSALLLALAAERGSRRIEVLGVIPSRPYVDLTLGVLGRFGVGVTVSGPADREVFEFQGGLRAPANPLVIEPDASAAAVALAAGCLGGRRIRVADLGAASAQGDVRITEHLAAFGCIAEAGPDELLAQGAPTRGARIDLEGEPDLAPVLAAIAAAAALDPGVRGSSRLDGLGTLPGKESSRIEVLAAGLRSLGLAVEAGPAHLEIGPGVESTPGAKGGELLLDPHGDHRMAFCFALLSLLEPRIRVLDPECTAKSWPGFWSDIAAPWGAP